MTYTLLNQMLTPDRVLDIWESEKQGEKNRIIILKAIQANDFVDAELSKPEYQTILRPEQEYLDRARKIGVRQNFRKSKRKRY